MATYRSGFDPPPRPGPPDARSRRLGTYIQPAMGREEYREADSAHISGEMEQRRAYTQPQQSRIQQTTLPRPSMRSPSPGGRAMTEPRMAGTGSRFGFGKPPNKVPTPARQPVPELKGKSSRNVLRRKPSSVAQLSGNPRSVADRSGSTSPSKWSQLSAENRPSIEASLKSADAYTEIFTRTRTKVPMTTDSPPIIPELDRYRTRPEQNPGTGKVELPPKLSTTDLPPPTPLLSGTPLYSGSSSSHHRYSGYSGSGYSASPSTRFSESPGPGAAYSRDTTPTSMSSQSPGIIAPLKPITPRLRQGSPAQTRPPVTRRRAGSNANETEGPIIDPHGLPSLRESLTSSSSNSTVKGEKKAEEKKEKKKKKRLSPLPPSPPPRKSSQKFKKPRSDTQESPSKASQTPAHPVMVSPVNILPVETSKQTTSLHNRNIPPTRPSRDGAPDLQSPVGESIAIIQSNLAGLTFPQDRRQSGLLRGVTGSPSQPQIIPRSAQGSRLPSRNPSPSPIHPSPRLGTPAPAGLGIVPDLRPQQPAAVTAAPSKGSGLRTPSPSTVAPKPRFGLFGRRTKTAPEIPTVETAKEKTVRKGPAAGTGHEGYGRYGARGRSTSAGGLGRGRERSMSAASSSQESISSTVTHDPFLLERMSPVIIAGGEVVENRNASSELSRTESNTSLLLGRPSLESKGSSKSGLGHEVSRTTLWPSALPKEAAKRGSMLVVPKGRRPSDSSDDGVAKSSLAFRRSIQRLNNSSTALQLPKPLNISAAGPGSSMTSLDASIMSDESQQEINTEGRGRKVLITKSKKPEKRPRSPRKWNFFHRSQPKTEPKPEPSVSVTIGRPPVKAIPHYALLDSSDEMPDYMEGVDLENIVRDAEVVDLSNEELDLLQFGEMKEKMKQERDMRMKAAKAKEEKLPAILFSSPEPIQITPSEMSQQRDLHLTKEEAPIRPSRLPQVGRIPKVVSARPQATSPKSFSRPFARLSMIQPLSSPTVLDKESIALGASPPKSSTPEPPRMNLQAAIDSEIRERYLESRSDIPATTNATDFLAFSPHRKGSEGTTSSSGGLSFVGTTAVIPEVDAELAEDEVWDEYDDLIQTSDSTKDLPIPISATSSHGVPFQYESYESRRIRKESKIQAKESPTLTSAPKISDLSISSRQPHASILTSSSVYSTDMSPRLKDSLAALPTPTTPLSFSDFFSGYGDRNNSISISMQGGAGGERQGHGSSESTNREQDPSSRRRRNSSNNSRKSNSSSASRSLSGSGSGLLPIRERERENENDTENMGLGSGALTPTISQVNLRVGSMTVSKWLTFGHVLFSPAREAIEEGVRGAGRGGSSKRMSVLVIDGLGNDDWSFYASETYPNATFYNLSPTSPPPSQSKTTSQLSQPPTAFPLTPPNHLQIQHPHLTTPTRFPFPTSTFSIVVFRFPPSLPLRAYTHIISEAKRVLLPGGYLELAVLDLDMLNMGPRARRAVRGLKTRMTGSSIETGGGSGFGNEGGIDNERGEGGKQKHQQLKEMWTGSAADMVLRLVGERGFVSVKSCYVGVPVASLIPRSEDTDIITSPLSHAQNPNPISNPNSKRNNRGENPLRSNERGYKAKDADTDKRPANPNLNVKKERSLADLMKSPSSDLEADEGIAKMVSRVGRWWYERCYESSLLTTTQHPQHPATFTDDQNLGLGLGLSRTEEIGKEKASIFSDEPLIRESEEWNSSFKLLVAHARKPIVGSSRRRTLSA